MPGCGSHSSSISPGSEVWLPGLCSASSPSGSSATVETFLRGEGGTRSNAFATLVERLGGPRPEVTATEIRQEKWEVAVFFPFLYLLTELPSLSEPEGIKELATGTVSRPIAYI